MLMTKIKEDRRHFFGIVALLSKPKLFGLAYFDNRLRTVKF